MYLASDVDPAGTDAWQEYEALCEKRWEKAQRYAGAQPSPGPSPRRRLDFGWAITCKHDVLVSNTCTVA